MSPPRGKRPGRGEQRVGAPCSDTGTTASSACPEPAGTTPSMAKGEEKRTSSSPMAPLPLLPGSRVPLDLDTSATAASALPTPHPSSSVQQHNSEPAMLPSRKVASSSGGHALEGGACVLTGSSPTVVTIPRPATQPRFGIKLEVVDGALKITQARNPSLHFVRVGDEVVAWRFLPASWGNFEWHHVTATFDFIQHLTNQLRDHPGVALQLKVVPTVSPAAERPLCGLREIWVQRWADGGQLSGVASPSRKKRRRAEGMASTDSSRDLRHLARQLGAARLAVRMATSSGSRARTQVKCQRRAGRTVRSASCLSRQLDAALDSRNTEDVARILAQCREASPQLALVEQAARLLGTCAGAASPHKSSDPIQPHTTALLRVASNGDGQQKAESPVSVETLRIPSARPLVAVSAQEARQRAMERDQELASALGRLTSFEERRGLLEGWLTLAADLLPGSGRSAMRKVNRDEAVQCVVDFLKETTHHSALFKEPNIRFGYYEGVTWVNEGGGVGETSIDAGGLTVELFTTFWSKLPYYMVSGWSAFVLEDGAQYFLPVALPVGMHSGDKTKVLHTFTALGKAFRWSILHKQPIPRQFASSFWFSYMLGVDRIADPSCPAPLQLTDEEVFLALLDHDPTAHKYLEPILKKVSFGKSLTAATLDFLPADLKQFARTIGPDNHLQLFRDAVHWVLVGSRRDALDALKLGFGTDSPMGPLATTLMHHFSDQERAAIVSGNENVTSEALGNLLTPIYPEAPVEGVVLRELQHNFSLLQIVIASEHFRPHLRSFLKFITSRDSLLTDRDEKIRVEFDSEMKPGQLPVAKTCFRQLFLPTRPLDSEADLADKLMICAKFSSSFGMK